MLAHGIATMACGSDRSHGLPFGVTVSGAGPHVDHQAVPVINQNMPQVTQPGRGRAALTVQSAPGIGHGSMGGVAALLAMPVAKWSVVVTAILAPYALAAGLGCRRR